MAHTPKQLASQPGGWLELILVSSGLYFLVAGGVFVLVPKLIEAQTPTGQNLVQILCYCLWAAAVLGVIGWRVGRHRPGVGWWQRLDLSRPTWRQLGWGLGALPVYYILSISALVILVLAGVVGTDVSQQIDLSLETGWAWWLSALVLVVLVPITEELLFRRWLYRRLAELSRFWLALPLAALLFGLGHSPSLVVVDTTVLAVVAILLYRRTGNLWPVIGLHAAKNAIALTLMTLGG